MEVLQSAVPSLSPPARVKQKPVSAALQVATLNVLQGESFHMQFLINTYYFKLNVLNLLSSCNI